MGTTLRDVETELEQKSCKSLQLNSKLLSFLVKRAAGEAGREKLAAISCSGKCDSIDFRTSHMH